MKRRRSTSASSLTINEETGVHAMNSRIRLVTALAAVIGVALVTPLWTPVSAATATASLTVSATVAANCTISTTPLAFGAYDPLVTNAVAALDATGGVVVACNKNTATTVGLALGAHATGSTRRMLDTVSGDFLTYELYQPGGYVTVWGNAAGSWYTPAVAPSKAPRTFQVNGRVAGGQDVSTGSYSDTVVATVTF
jgi:spore coat protein U-like protein